MKPRVEIVAADALTAAGGNRLVAEAKLVKALLSDHQLLIEAAAPYLKPIALRLLERAARPLPEADRPSEGGLALKALAENPGYNPMQAEKPVSHTAASVRHVRTMQMLAASYRTKEKEKV